MKKLLIILLLPVVFIGHAWGVTCVRRGTPTYTYLGFPTLSNGTPDDSGTNWLSYGVATIGEDRVYVREVLAADHGAGTADAINFYSFTDPADDFDATFLCLYIEDDLAGKVDVKSIVSVESWTGYITIIEESSGSLDYLSTEDLYIGLCIDEIKHGSYAVHDADDDTSGAILYYNADWSTNPPSTITTWTTGSNHGYGIILRSE